MPQQAAADTRHRPTIAHLRLSGSGRPPLWEVIDLAFLLRGALQKNFDRVVGGGVSMVFSGHGADGSKRQDQHQHAHFLHGCDPLSGRAEDLWIWAPEGFGDAEQAAIASLRELRFRDIAEPLRVALLALGNEDSLELPQLLGPATRWRSVTPFISPRHSKRRGGRIVDGPKEQILRELLLRDFPAPAEIRLLESGSWDRFKTTQPGAHRRVSREAVGAELRFSAPVKGPIAIGAQSHFGLGNFAPTQ
jgi:CRISPR-associated protein Csb2